MVEEPLHPGWRQWWRSLHLSVPPWSLGSPSFLLLLPTLPSVVCLDVTVAAAQTGCPRSVSRRARFKACTLQPGGPEEEAESPFWWEYPASAALVGLL